MKRKKVVFRILLLPLLVLVVLSTGCSNPTKLLEKEKAYGTRSEKFAIFHRIAEADRGLGLRFPGFLVGIEKAYRDKIGILDGIDIDNLDKNKFNSNNFLPEEKLNYLKHIEKSISLEIENKVKENNICIALSGGVDSTLVMSLLRKTKPDIKIDAISLKFADSVDETEIAGNIANKFNADHHVILIENFLEFRLIL